MTEKIAADSAAGDNVKTQWHNGGATSNFIWGHQIQASVQRATQQMLVQGHNLRLLDEAGTQVPAAPRTRKPRFVSASWVNRGVRSFPSREPPANERLYAKQQKNAMVFRPLRTTVSELLHKFLRQTAIIAATPLAESTFSPNPQVLNERKAREKT